MDADFGNFTLSRHVVLALLKATSRHDAYRFHFLNRPAVPEALGLNH